MTQTPMKQVAVRMTPEQHHDALRRAKRDKVSFGEFVRLAVDHRLHGYRADKCPVCMNNLPGDTMSRRKGKV
jgi:hypothetical protein